MQRCIYPMINEGAKILDEGKALRASDIDIVWINGYGWPVYRGGPMFYGDTIGLDKVLAKLKSFQATMGDDFKPVAAVGDARRRRQELHAMKSVYSRIGTPSPSGGRWRAAGATIEGGESLPDQGRPDEDRRGRLGEPARPRPRDAPCADRRRTSPVAAPARSPAEWPQVSQAKSQSDPTSSTFSVGARLIVEADGSGHNESPHDGVRDASLARVGWKVLRFWNYDVLQNRESVLDANFCTRRPPRWAALPSSGASRHLLPEGEGSRTSPRARSWDGGSTINEQNLGEPQCAKPSSSPPPARRSARPIAARSTTPRRQTLGGHVIAEAVKRAGIDRRRDRRRRDGRALQQGRPAATSRASARCAPACRPRSPACRSTGNAPPA